MGGVSAGLKLRVFCALGSVRVLFLSLSGVVDKPLRCAYVGLVGCFVLDAVSLVRASTYVGRALLSWLLLE